MIHEVVPEPLLFELELEPVLVATTSQQGLSGVSQKEYDCLQCKVWDNQGILQSLVAGIQWLIHQKVKEMLPWLEQQDEGLLLVEELGLLEGAGPPKSEEKVATLLHGMGVLSASDVVEVVDKEKDKEKEKELKSKEGKKRKDKGKGKERV